MNETEQLRARVDALEGELRQTRRQLDETRVRESLYRGLAEHAPDAMLVYNPSGRIVFINAVCAGMFGAESRDQILGRQATDFVHPDSLEDVRGHIDKVINRRESAFRPEQKRLRLNGSTYIADVSVSAIDWEGEPAGLVVVRDVTERIQSRVKYEAAETLRRSAHQRLLEAIDVMTDGFALFDSEYRLQVYNQRYVEDVWSNCGDYVRPGLTFEEMVSFGVRNGLWAGSDMPFEEIAALALKRHRQLPSLEEIEYPSGKWLRQNKRRTREGGVVAVYSDVTESKRNEATLKESEDRYRSLLEALPDGVLIHVDGKIAYVNDQAVRMFGAESAGDLIGRSSLSFVPEDMVELFLARQKSSLAGAMIQAPVRQKRIRLDGSVFDVETVSSYIEWEGRPGFIGVVRDITERIATERRVRETERRFSAVTDNIPGAVFQRVLSPEGVLGFSYVSSGIAGIIGHEAEEVVRDSAPMLEALHPDFRDEYMKLLKQSARDLTPLDIEMPLAEIKGERRWVRSTATPRRRSDGTVVWDGILTDITRQKRAEERAREAHEWLLHAIDVLPSGFMLWDRDDRLTLWNERVKSYHSDPSVFRVGTSFDELVAAPYNDVRSLHGDEEAERWLQARRAQRERGSGVHEFRTRQGRWLLLTERATPDGHIVTLITDVTDRKESEERLKESDERYRALVNLLPDAVYVHRDGVIVLSNEAANSLFGARSSKDLIGLTLMELTHPDYRDVVSERANFLAAPGTKTAFMRQKRIRLDGSWFWAEVAAAAFEWDGARGGIVVIRDVTEQIRAESQLVESKETAELANRAKTEFLANISHELRTPLNAIIGFSDLIQRETFGPVGSPQYVDYIRDIHASGTHLHDVINDILDLAKVEAGKLELNEERFDLQAVIGRCVRVVAPRADENGLRLQEEIPADLPAVFGDERKIKQIIINLLGNAVKFTERGGKITIRAQMSASGGLEIVIADTGIGMAAADIPRALTPFSQVDSTMTRRHEGTGLGLPLTNSLVQLHGGTLSISSELGKGTSVTVWLPPSRVVSATSTSAAE